MRCEDEKMFYRPPLLEEPCAQTLWGKMLSTIIKSDGSGPGESGDIWRPWFVGSHIQRSEAADVHPPILFHFIMTSYGCV